MTRERPADTSLASLMDQRAACVRELASVCLVLAEVQQELRDWREERAARGVSAPESLKALWTDLEEHERALALRWLDLEATRRAIAQAIQERLRQRPMAG